MNEEGRCPYCRQRAPIMLRGVDARCSVCGRRRVPFAAPAMNLAGTPHRIGGAMAKGFGCAAAVLGSAAATGLGFLFASLFGVTVGWAVALPIAIVAWSVALTLFFGGRWLGRLGEKKAHRSRVAAVRALAAHQRGSVTAADAARTLRCSEAEADAFLTELARSLDENIGLDVDDDGVVHYLFGAEGGERRWRILEERARVAVDDQHLAEWQAEREAESHGHAPRLRR